MAGLYVREKHLWNQMANDKFTGLGTSIPGQVFYVMPGASATHGAFTRNHRKFVFDSFELAYAQAVTGRGDAIVFLPGAHTLTVADSPVAKNNLSIWGPEAWAGLPVQKPSAIITSLAASNGMAVTGTDVSLRGITIVPITAKIGVNFSAAALRGLVTGCHFDMNVAVANVATKGIMVSGAAVDLKVKSNYFYSLGAHGPFITVTGLINYTIDDNDFVVLTGGTMANAILVGAAAQGLINKNRFYGGTLTAAVDGTGATVAASCRIFDNAFGVLCTVPIDNFSATNLTDLKDNRVATIGGGTGGTLISVNT